MNTQRKLIVALSLCAVVAVPNVASAVAVSGQGTWETTLQGRDLDGDLATFEAYYDTVLNITWLADANAGVGSSNDMVDGYSDGHMMWTSANAWAANLNPYGSGITGWRLPTIGPVDGDTSDDENISVIGTEDRGHNISAPGTLYAGSTASEMAHMFYNTLGDMSYCNPTTSTVSSCSGPQAGWGLTNTGPFTNIQSGYYWSSKGLVPSSFYAWFFGFDSGVQDRSDRSDIYYAWAVHSGDVGTSAVPVPSAAWLFGSGLIGLIGSRARSQPSKQ
ncbi:MAG: DUF1566 domain-containing protein [Gammaproteobacteria bacterium]|nr:DUF1566 domain-containing protein [Gammaproteobacteria bacterium]